MSKKASERDVRDDDGPLIEKAEREAPQLLRSPDFFRRFLADIRQCRGRWRGTECARSIRRGDIAAPSAASQHHRQGEKFSGQRPSRTPSARILSDLAALLTRSMVVAHALEFVMSQSYPNSILYFYEMDAAHVRIARPNRLIASEGRRISAACISTAEQCLEVEVENRHLSIWMDESPEQTKRIARAYIDRTAGRVITGEDISVDGSPTVAGEAKSRADPD